MMRIALRSYFSTPHLWGSGQFAARAYSIESARSGRPKFDIEHRALVVAAIVEAGAFLECAVNELFKDCVDAHDASIKSLSSAHVHALRQMWIEWHSDGRRVGTLKKYDTALSCCELPRFDRDVTPFQEAALLLKLRNALIHYTPKSRSIDDTDELADALRGRFDLNLLAAEGNPYFPDKCLGAGCANWAFNSARTFADAFFLRIGVRPNYRSSGFLESGAVRT